MAKAKHFKFCTLVRHGCFSIGITDCPLSRRGHGHMTFSNLGKSDNILETVRDRDIFIIEDK